MSKHIPLKDCKRCRRLHHHLKKTKLTFPDYFCQLVPAFGDDKARLLIVGLAPGLHGANATGIPFTGDASGEFLFKTLHAFGFASHADANKAGQHLRLYNCTITNAVKCLPPQNKPNSKEAQTCGKHFLKAELEGLVEGSVVLALGSIAHNAILRCLGKPLVSAKFGHNHHHQLSDNLSLVDSYHCSRYNTQTKRLTQPMFDEVFYSVSNIMNLQ